METTREIIAAIGSDRFQKMVNVGPKSVSRAEKTNLFTASWYRVISEELRSMKKPPPPIELFTFIPEGGRPGLKKRGRKPPQPD